MFFLSHKKTLLAFFLSCTVVTFAQAEDSSPLEKLMQGNKRYVESSTVCHEDWGAKRIALAQGQTPFAVIIACSDSRVPPEIIFDQTLGDLFVIRVAGNVIDDFALGSVEYAVEVLKANLIVVLGHSSCGAVDAALKGLSFDNHIPQILKKIAPAVKATRYEPENRLEKTIKMNVLNVKKCLEKARPTLKKLFDSGDLSIRGAYYCLESGEVELL